MSDDIVTTPSDGQPERFSEYLFLPAILTASNRLTWLVEKFLVAGRVYQFFGKWKSGKTLVLQHLVLHIMQGIPWCGRRTLRSVVVYVAGEAVHDIVLRIQAHAKKYGDITADSTLFVLRTKPAHMADLEPARKLREHLEAILENARKEYGPEIHLVVVFDPLARNFGPGRSESSDVDMGDFINHIQDEIAQPLGATVFIVHHPGHSDSSRGRGHSNLPGLVDGTLRVERKDGAILLTAGEMRSVPSNEDRFAFQIESVDMEGEDNFGNPISAPVVVEIDSHEQAHTAGLGKRQRHALELFEELYRNHAENCKKHGGTPRVLMGDWNDALVKAGYDRNKTTEIRKPLEERGLVKREGSYYTPGETDEDL